MGNSYNVPTALTVLSGIFLIIGAICAVIVTADTVLRKGWRSMMLIMIPVWIINATYMGPITFFLYSRFGRPSDPKSGQTVPSCHAEGAGKLDHENEESTTEHHGAKPSSDATESHEEATAKPSCCHSKRAETASSNSQNIDSSSSSTTASDAEKQTPHGHTSSPTRPMWATVASGVSHCGAGCVLGDLVGEWLVYGTSASISAHSIWAALLIDYAFALLFGIVFQYFSIAPMSGQYGPKTVWRAVKADILSLTSFEVGAFGWMIIYQVGIWGYRLGTDIWTYWWMMQVGMAMGFCTAYPVNWWLLKKGVTEACC